MKVSLHAVVTALVAGGAAAAPSLGQAADGGETIVVVGRTLEETLPQELQRYGSDVEVMTSDELREGLLVDVSQALQMRTPGVFISSQAGPFSYMDISLQGSRTQDMLFLVDGVRINNRLYPTTITDTLPVSMVERVEVLKGGQGLFYGTNAAAGVINVVTRGYTDELDGLVTAGGGSFETWRTDGYVRGAAGPGNFVAYASYDSSEGYRVYDNAQPSATDQKRGYDVAAYGLKYRWELLDDLSLDARWQHNDADLDYLRYNLTVVGENSRDEEIASLGINYDPAASLEIQVKGYWHDWDTRYTDIVSDLDDPGEVIVESDNLFWGFEDEGVNALARWTPGGPFDFLAGYDYQTYSALDEVWHVEQVEEEVNAVFAQIRTSESLIQNGALALGVRYNKTGGASSTVWNLSGRYDFSSALYVQGIVGTSFLLPNFEQLYVIEPDWYLGNPDVEPEESENLNLSVGGRIGADRGVAWEVTYFARDISNLIDGLDFSDPAFAATGIDRSRPFRGLDISDDTYSGVFYNLDGEVEVRGFELQGSADLGGGFGLVASYTRSETEMDSSGTQIARIPEDYAKAGASYDAERWGAGASVLWVGKVESPVRGAAVDYGDYTVVDLDAHVFLDPDGRHKLTARLQNALDEDYATRVAPGTTDAGAPILVRNRGVPQSYQVSYSYAF